MSPCFEDAVSLLVENTETKDALLLEVGGSSPDSTTPETTN